MGKCRSFQGVCINKSPIKMNLTADLFIEGAVGTTFNQLTTG